MPGFERRRTGLNLVAPWDAPERTGRRRARSPMRAVRRGLRDATAFNGADPRDLEAVPGGLGGEPRDAVADAAAAGGIGDGRRWMPRMQGSIRLGTEIKVVPRPAADAQGSGRGTCRAARA